jgi:hypothetical protein
MKALRATFLLSALGIILCSHCTPSHPTKAEKNPWADAKWIGYELLADSLKIIPAVHGNGNELGNKGKKRSVVPMFRRSFEISKEIDQATIYISGLGHYELYVNGQKTADRFLAPGWTNYLKRCFYNTYDITDQLKKGKNAMGMLVGNGFFNVNRERYRKLVVAYGYPRLIFSVHLLYKDGSEENVVSNSSCKVAPSPITLSSIYGGEDYDATLEQPGWNAADFDDTAWNDAIALNDPIGMLVPEEDYPLKVIQEFGVANTFQSANGNVIYDFGQNASGIISLRVKGNKGAQIKIIPDELVNPDGFLTQRSSGGPYELNYTLKGDGIESWQPRFTYYGFRYAEVHISDPSDATDKTEIVEMKLLHTRNSSPAVGTFSCSDTLFNQTFDLINWGIKSNMASVTTDCPHREKLGWLEQTYLIGPSMHYNFDIRTLFKKIVQDMIDSQLDDGLVPDIAPEYVPFQGGFRDSPEWGSASVIIPWQVYRWYGEKEILEKAYPMMKRYVQYLEGKATNRILDYGLGDWYDLGPKFPGEAQLTPKALTATSIYYYDLQILSKVAQTLGYNEDFEIYSGKSDAVREAFLAKFFQSSIGVIGTGSQTSYAMPLYVGLIPESDYARVFNNLVQAIADDDYALTSGDIGYHFLVQVLSINGRSDVLYRMNNRSDRPGYGYQLKKGATALTESWAALAESSNNHMMLGHLMEWFYAGLGGIYQAENSVAYSDIVIAPKPVGNIRWVNCTYNSVKGNIVSSWKLENDALSMSVEIPNAASATVVVPESYWKSMATVKNSITGEEILKYENSFHLGAGKYEIIVK